VAAGFPTPKFVGLMRDFEGVVVEKKAEEDAEKLLSGNFNMTSRTTLLVWTPGLRALAGASRG
jgi:hypothetical protein